MPIFREALRIKIIDKGARLVKAVESIISPRTNNIGARRQNLLAALRAGQNLIGVASSKLFNPFNYQANAQKYFNRLTSGIKRFINDRIISIQSLTVRSPARSKFRLALNNLIERSEKRLTDLAKLLIDRDITPAQFRESLSREIRQLHLGSLIIGISGVGNISSNAIEIVQARTSKQLNFLNDFVKDIQEIVNKQSTFTPKQAEQIIRTTKRYSSSAKAVASDAQRELLRSAYGDREDEEEILAMRVLSNNENHCQTCVNLAGEWHSLDQFVPLGNSECRSSCQCYHIFARASDLGPLPKQVQNL